MKKTKRTKNSKKKRLLSSGVFSRALSVLAYIGLGLVILLVLLIWAPWRNRTSFGTEQKIGAGTVKSYVTRQPSGAPVAIGVTMTAGALEQLPTQPNAVSRCFDVNGDGVYEHNECVGDDERMLELPAGAKAANLPFKWIMVNWNAAGHPAPYNRPHFDFHFFTADHEQIEAIAPGSCGEFVNCDDFKRATRPLDPKYLPPGYINVGAVVPRMGNHLFNSQAPEMAKGPNAQPFTHTFIYGAFDGNLIFWEPMITPGFLRQTRDACFDIEQPKAFKESGYYPTQYCMRQDSPSGNYTVSLEHFVYAKAQ